VNEVVEHLKRVEKMYEEKLRSRW